MKTRNRRYPDRLGWTGTKLENRERFYFPDSSQISAMVGDHSRQVTNIASLENLGQTSDDYPIYRQNLGWSAKSKIPDRLGFSRHMKTRLIMHT